MRPGHPCVATEPATTRSTQPGIHEVRLRISGKDTEGVEFELVEREV